VLGFWQDEHKLCGDGISNVARGWLGVEWANQITKIGRPDLRVWRRVERGRDRQGETGGEVQGGSAGGDTGELFDDLDCFFASARISTEVYATSRLQRTGALGPEEFCFGRSERVGPSNLGALERYAFYSKRL
jgi:hypothetical protein